MGIFDWFYPQKAAGESIPGEAAEEYKKSNEAMSDFLIGSTPDKADYEPTQWYTSPEQRAGINSQIAALEAMGNRTPEQEAQLARLRQSLMGGADVGFAQSLRSAAMGEGGPSAAEQMMQRGGAAAAQRSMGMARGMRGVAPGMAARMAMRSNQALGQQVASQAGQLRAQEMQQARGQYLKSEEQRRLAWALQQQLMAQQAIANAGQPGQPGALQYVLQGLSAIAPMPGGK